MIRTRFAPSPTGYLHIGGLRTALYNFIFAKKNNGQFILRIEDTDQKRLVRGAAEKIIKSLNSFDINFDEGPNLNEKYGPYYQSKRLYIYHKYCCKLIENKSAYLCYVDDNQNLKPENNIDKSLSIINQQDTKSRFIVKFKVPSIKNFNTFDDLRGKVVFDLSLIDDFIIIKSDGFPTYHFANVVDDHLMKISHVIRGEEWLSSLPKHMLLYNSLEFNLPHFIHLPLLLNPDHSKLSKRQGDVDVDKFIEKGYLKSAVLNFIALLGWHPDNDREIFNILDLIENFSIPRIQKSGSVFDIKKLNWMNSEYIKSMDLDTLFEVSQEFFKKEIDIKNTTKLGKAINFFKQRSSTLLELNDSILPFYSEPNNLKEEVLTYVNEKKSQDILKFYLKSLSIIECFDIELSDRLIKDIAEKFNVKGKEIFFPLRGVLYGSLNGPDLFTIIDILGLDESKRRIEQYIK